MKKVLVLGAGEFIGRRTVASLAGSGWAVPLAGMRRAAAGSEAGVESVPVDPADPAQVAAAVRGVDAVVHCVTGSPRLIVDSAQALFTAAAAAASPPLVVLLSSMAVYGSACGDVDEDAPLLGDLGAYSIAKIRAEQIAARHPRRVVLRHACVYGPGSEQWSGRVARWLLAGRMGDLGPAGDGWCNLVHIDDLVAAIGRSLREPAAEGLAFNMAMPDPPTWNDYLVRYARALGAVPVRRIAGRRLAFESKVLAVPLKLLEMAGQAARLPGRGAFPPPIPPSILRLASQEIRLLPGRAQRVLGWTSKPLDDGLREATRWFNGAR